MAGAWARTASTLRGPAPRPPRRLAAPLLISVCLVAACSGGGDPKATGAPEPTASSSAPPAGTAAPTTSPAPSAAAAPAVVLLRSRFAPTVTFQSASGNLACWFAGDVICRAKAHAWTSQAADPQTECPPAKRVSGIQLTKDVLAERSDCYDQAENPDTVLAYGHGLELDGVRCVSEQRGITCVRTADGVGFSISRATLSHRPWDSPLLHVPAATLDHAGTTVLPSGFHVAFWAGDHLADCLLDADTATCLVNSSATAAPGDPTCEFDQALTAEVRGTRRGRLVYDCRSDANGGQDQLRAGESIQVGDLRCSAGATRVRCAHLDGAKHGFEVDSTTFRGF